jgi:alpha-ribazole phosphatase
MTDRLLDLLRHGEAVGGTRFRGRLDDPLTDTGWSQMRRAVQTGVPEPDGWHRIISSPASRCRAFAERLARERTLPLDVAPAFAERDFGDWEGLSADAVDPVALTRFWTDPERFTPPNAESLADFRRRVRSGLSQLLDDERGHTLLVTHGGVIRILIAEVLGISADRLLLIEVPHACRTRLRLAGGGWRPSLVEHGSANWQRAPVKLKRGSLA